MSIEVQSVMAWSFGRLMNGMGPIKIAVPAWRLPREKATALKGGRGVSQQELLDLFCSELRPAKPTVKSLDTDFTLFENMQLQCMARLRSALYAT